MANTLQIKRRSTGAAGAPTTLKSGEPAYNAVSDVLYIGDGDDGAGNATTIEPIGGKGAFVNLTSAQTISGKKTHSVAPASTVDAVAGNDLVRKSQMDAINSTAGAAFGLGRGADASVAVVAEALAVEARVADANCDFAARAYRRDGVRQGVNSVVTTSRTAIIAAVNLAGGLDVAPANGVLVTDGGLATYADRTCRLPYTNMSGGIAGSPGTLPTGWAWAGDLHTTGGLTRQIVSVGTRNGLPAIRIRWSGVAAASVSGGLYFAGFNGIAASPGQTWYGGATFEFVTKTGLENPFGGISFRTAGGVSVAGGPAATNIADTTVGMVRNVMSGGVAITTTAGASVIFGFSVTSGATVDVDVWIYPPQLEMAADLGPIIVNTTGAALTVNTDQIAVDTAAADWSMLIKRAGRSGASWVHGSGALTWTPGAAKTQSLIVLPRQASKSQRDARVDVLFPAAYQNAVVDGVINGGSPTLRIGTLTTGYAASAPGVTNAVEYDPNRRWEIRTTARMGQKSPYDISVGNLVDRCEFICGSGNSGAETIRYGTEIWQAFDMWIDDTGRPKEWCLIMQHHQYASHPTVGGINPPFCFVLDTDGVPGLQIYARGESNAGVSTGYIRPQVVYADGQYPRRQWVSWVIRAKYGWAGDGLLQIWRDGVLVADRPTIALGYEWDAAPTGPGGIYPHLGVYRASAVSGSPWVNADPTDMVARYANAEWGAASLAARITAPLDRG